MITDKTCLDVGCGHGDFTIKCGSFAKGIVGFDCTDAFIQTGNANRRSNVTFVVGNAKDGLPFASDEFDCAYNRKGPTSAYPELQRVVKKGGNILGLHPGDDLGKELPTIFPHLFPRCSGTPIADKLTDQLVKSRFTYYRIQTYHAIEYLKTPHDVVLYRCFGQTPELIYEVMETSLPEITRIFNEHATVDGLPITFSRYIVRAIV
ncbi:MAG TPA: class I SAM-dependent methyltransferase [Sporosarcina sp.]|nr:class I SAM-dependent methyltransferase [Sporosarcina sp.]